MYELKLSNNITRVVCYKCVLHFLNHDKENIFHKKKDCFICQSMSTVKTKMHISLEIHKSLLHDKMIVRIGAQVRSQTHFYYNTGSVTIFCTAWLHTRLKNKLSRPTFNRKTLWVIHLEDEFHDRIISKTILPPISFTI